MKILIINGYIRENNGDAALMSVLAHQLRGVFPDANIVVSGMEDSKEHPDFEGFRNVGSMRLYVAAEHISKPRRIIRKFLVFGISYVWAYLPFRQVFGKILPLGITGELLAINTADVVVSIGGGYIIGQDSFAGNLNILFLTLPIRLAEKLGKMIVLAPQSFGPFANNWQRRIVLKTLNAAQLVCVREDKSYFLLKNLGVNENIMCRTIDSGFAYKSESTRYSEIKSNGMRVGITARNWLKGGLQENYEKGLANFIVNIQKKYNAEVVLVPQVAVSFQEDDDRIVNERINVLAIKGGARSIQVMDEIDLPDIKNLYSTFTFTVGTRFHSVIFSLTSLVPAIAIEYEHKTSGIMHDLNLDEWVIKIEDVTTERLNVLFDKLVLHREEYVKHLNLVLPPYVQRTNDVPYLIKRAYERHLVDIRKK